MNADKSMTKSSSRSVRKSWNFSLSQTEALHAVLERVLEPIGCSALVLPDGMVLHIRPSGPADLATLPQAASLCQQYLRLRDGEVAMLNDPYSGGTHLSDLTLVMGAVFDSPGTGTEADILIVRRLSLPPRFTGRNNVDDEGVRIPPTPLVSGRELNTGLLEAVAMHPLAPVGLGAAVKDALLGLEQVRAELKSLGADPAGELKKANLKRYLADSGRVFEMKMNRLPLGMTTVSTQLEGGATVKLILTVSESRIHFDFAGTDASTTIGLTEMTTFGACLAAVTSVLREKIPMNAGSFEHIQVSTPAKTLLSTRAPSGTFRGINAGVAIVAELVQAALAKLNPLLAVAPAIGADSHFLLTFNDGRVLAGHLPSGAGAQKAADGADALALWAPRFAFDITLEESERRFPLVWQQAGVRPSSGGKGQKRGGDGAVRAFRVSEAAKFRWLSAQRGAKATGLEGGQAGLPTLIEVVRVKPTKAGASGETEREEFSASEGEIALQPGDKVTLLTSGGAGYGKVNE